MSMLLLFCTFFCNKAIKENPQHLEVFCHSNFKTEVIISYCKTDYEVFRSVKYEQHNGGNGQKSVL